SGGSDRGAVLAVLPDIGQAASITRTGSPEQRVPPGPRSSICSRDTSARRLTLPQPRSSGRSCGQRSSGQGARACCPPRRAESVIQRAVRQAGSSTNRTSGRSSRRVLAVVGVVLLLGAAGALGVWQLGGGSERGDGRPATESPVAGPVAVPSIAATVPADVISTGRLVVGVNVPYPPAEFKDASGHIVGFYVDLMNAVTRTLGLVPDYREAPYDAII